VDWIHGFGGVLHEGDFAPRRIVRSVTPMTAAACHQVIFFAIAFIIRSISKPE